MNVTATARTLKTTGLMALALAATTARAAEAETPFVTGSLSLTLDSHFISYGADVWGGGSDINDALIHPNLEYVFAVAPNVSFILGTWMDINDKGNSNVGTNKVQEVDIWAGFGTSVGDTKVTLLYQEWMYASTSERIVDLKFGFAGALAPSFTVHGRVDGEGMDTGAAFVAGISPGTTAGKAALSLPISVAADTDGFHGGDAGFSYASVGASASVPLGGDGSPSLGAGVTFYHTNEDVIPGNVDEDFVTGSLTLSLAF